MASETLPLDGLPAPEYDWPEIPHREAVDCGGCLPTASYSGCCGWPWGWAFTLQKYLALGAKAPKTRPGQDNLAAL